MRMVTANLSLRPTFTIFELTRVARVEDEGTCQHRELFGRTKERAYLSVSSRGRPN